MKKSFIDMLDEEIKRNIRYIEMYKYLRDIARDEETWQKQDAKIKLYFNIIKELEHIKDIYIEGQYFNN